MKTSPPLLATLLVIFVGVGAVHFQPDHQLLEPAFDQQSTVICTSNCDQPSVDCAYSAWSSWGPCYSQSTCGGPYFTNQTRTVVQQAVAYGNPCTTQAMVQSRACTQDEINVLTNSSGFQSTCAVGCQQGDWVASQPCSVTQASCPPRGQAPNNGLVQGGITYTRPTLVQPQYGGAPCGPSVRTDVCYFSCSYDCQWGPWQPAGCSLPCVPPTGALANGSTYTNQQKYTRSIQYFAVNGGAQCQGDATMYNGTCLNTANFPTCCPGCTLGNWSDWTSCSVTCGTGGTMSRTRTVAAPANWYTNAQICGTAMPVCPDSIQTQECCAPPCPGDCSCSDWSPWSDCMTDNSGGYACGDGTQTRSRGCNPPSYGGNPCPATVDTKNCTLPGCPQDCLVSPWSTWSTCPATCGVRLSMTRTRTIITVPLNGGSPCPDLTDTHACPCNPCPVDCQLSPWNPWGDCSSPCGDGVQQRTRDVLVVPAYGGIGCNVTYEQRNCIVNTNGYYYDDNGVLQPANQPCSVNCQVSDWSDWGPCSKSCTSDEDATFPGIRQRTRTVTVQAQYQGITCPHTIEQDFCATQCCPVNMEVGDWSAWSTCTATCGGGWQTQTRQITVYPRCNGTILNEPLSQTQPCNTACCNKTCTYNPYSNWSPCLSADRDTVTRYALAGDTADLLALFSSASQLQCPSSIGYSYRTRDSRNNGCNLCTDTFNYRNCSIQCPVDCVMGPWGPWSACDRDCGWGAQNRTRFTQTPSNNGGVPCPCTEDTQPCYNGPCCSECVLTPYGPWEPCTASCGGGTTTRRRYVNMSTTLCPDLECMKAGLSETQSCNTQDCPGPCIMSAWSTWSPCSSSCGLGFQYHTRTVEQSGDGRCDWDYEEQPCILEPCPIPCTYTEFTEWSPCAASCIPPNAPTQVYLQFRSQYRVSGNTPDCAATLTQSQNCIPYPPMCDQLCVVSDWGNWGNCSAQYGWGERRRDRTVLVQPTGKEVCPQLYQIDRCYIQPPSDNCTWSTWGDWNPCTASCRTQLDIPTQYKERFLLRGPSTIYTGASGNVSSSNTLNDTACGVSVLTQTCTNLPFCPSDCVMSKWSAWSACKAPGIKTRTRIVVSQAQFGGQPCNPCLTEVDSCTMKANDLPSGQCEVGDCVAVIEQEIAQQTAASAGAGY